MLLRVYFCGGPFLSGYAVAVVFRWRAVLTGHAVAGVKWRSIFNWSCCGELFITDYAFTVVQWRAVYNRLFCCRCAVEIYF